MAAPFVSTANSFFSCPTRSPLSPVAPISRAKSTVCICKATSEEDAIPRATKRRLSVSFIAGFIFSLGGKGWLFDVANAAVLEAEDDEELLEKVKKDRKKRLERQGIINSSKKEKGYLQELVYKLSEVGQAIDKNDLLKASTVLGPNMEAEWLKNANTAFTKLSSSPEEKTEVDTFNSSLASLILSVKKNDVESSKVAFVSSASALERWTALTGLVEELKGL